MVYQRTKDKVLEIIGVEVQIERQKTTEERKNSETRNYPGLWVAWRVTWGMTWATGIHG